MMSSKALIALHSQKSVDYTIFDCKWIPNCASFISAGLKADGSGVLQIYELVKIDGRRDIKLSNEVTRSNGLRCLSFAASGYLSKQIALADFNGQLSVLEMEDLNKSVFNVHAHQGIITCMDGVGGIGIGEGPCELATGGEDGIVRIWDMRQPTKAVMVLRSNSDEIKIECWAVAFGGAYNPVERCLCSGYENGDVKLFDMRKGEVYWEKNLKNGICSIEFDRKDISLNRMAVGCLQSRLVVVRLSERKDGGEEEANNCTITKTKVDKSATVWNVRHLPQNRSIVSTCCGSGLLTIWKYGLNDELKEVGNALLSTQPINCMDWNREMIGLGCVGALDQSVRVIVATKLNIL